MYDFEGCPGQLDGLAPKGFIMEDHELFLFGRCADCAAA
jgi:Fur family ferric uptake transcriptional regulator